MQKIDIDNYIKSEIKYKVGFISIYNKKGNSLSKKMLKNLAKEINSLSSEDICCIIIQSDYDGIFCSGANFDELLEIDNFIEAENFFFDFANLLNTMRKSPKIIISKVDGKAVGGGVGIICTSDFVIATNRSFIKLSEISLGLGPFVIQPSIERKIGVNYFTELALFPKEWKSPEWCFKKGIFNKVLNSINLLEDELTKITEDFCSYPKKTLDNIKLSLWEGYENWDSLLYQKAEKTAKLSISKEVRNILEQFKI